MSWRPTASLSALRTRSEIVWKLRSCFHDLGFQEVHTPVLSRDTVVDRHLHPISVPAASLELDVDPVTSYFLQTSPEFAMKRLLAAGVSAMYQIGPAFRSGERGSLHNPEFTMVEWYRTGDDLAAGIALLSQLVAVIGRTQPVVASYRSVFLQHAGCDPLDDSLAELAACGAGCAGVNTDWTDDRDEWLNLIFSAKVQPELGHETPSIVTHYPSSQSALARICPSDPRTAERFELFIDGVELANGYHELIDADELLARNTHVNDQRLNDGRPALPQESQLLQAMRDGLPECSGCALGLDRLVMIATQADSIDQVLAFPVENC